MKTPKPLIDAEGEVRELIGKDVRAMRGVRTLPASTQRKVGQCGTQKTPPKERITIT